MVWALNGVSGHAVVLCAEANSNKAQSVSYTHLTLPTN